MEKETSSSFHLLDEMIQKWIWRQSWTTLRDIQENAIPPILARNSDVIISAATAGGKTEAAFMPIITELLRDKKVSKPGYKVLYISPLKALINDQYNRLCEMTRHTGIDVTPWHGDIDSARKRTSLKAPEGILVITPEALEAFFATRRQHLEKAFSDLSYIVIDEFHSFMGNERGMQLQSLLMRVQQLNKEIVPRIALSATFSDFESVTKALRGQRDYPCTIPDAGNSDHEIKVLIKEYTESKKYDPQDDLVEDLYGKMRGSNNLIFANSKERVEQIAAALTECCEENNVPNEFLVHHGNMSKSERQHVEWALQKGNFPTTAVCTSTLELGVDIGKVKSIVQIGTANSVLSLRQRLGRSGRRGEPSILRIYSIDTEGNDALNMLRPHLFQNIAVIELLREKKYETTNPRALHLSTLVQQVLSLICQFGGFQIKDGWECLCKNGAFNNVTPQMFIELMRGLGNANIVSQTHTGEIIIGIEGEKIVKAQDFYVAFNTFPEYSLIDKASQKILGTLQYLPHIGEYIIFGGRKWRVESTSRELKNIMLTQVKFGELPSFISEPIEGDGLIIGKMKEIYISDAPYPYLDANARDALHEGRDFFRKHSLAVTPFLNEGREKMIFTWKGAKVNRTLVLALMHNDGVMRSYNSICIENVTEENILEVASKPFPDPKELAKLEKKRAYKEFNKYDHLLPDNLLDEEYVASRLDPEATKLYLKEFI